MANKGIVIDHWQIIQFKDETVGSFWFDEDLELRQRAQESLVAMSVDVSDYPGMALISVGLEGTDCMERPLGFYADKAFLEKLIADIQAIIPQLE